MVEQLRIDGVELEGELGRGAHSIVYRGRQNGVACAVKVPRVKARWTRWIYREAIALARVKHPSLPAVLEVGDVNDLPYLVMDLIEGKTLAEQLASGLVDEAHTLDIAAQLANVRSAVHDAGLVHRDVKPRNIVVESSSSALKLVDFGFATPMERVGTRDAAGTAAYAAPEQLSPSGCVDARTDLYAVGRVLLECVTGQAAMLRGGNGAGLEIRTELLAQGVSPGLAEIIAGLVRRAPNERYPSSRALQSDIERCIAGLPVLGPKGYERGRATTGVVGRRNEIDRIVSSCRDLRAGGVVVLLRGARGAGKSRVLEATEAGVRGSARTILTFSRQDDPPLSTLRRVLESYCADHVEPGEAGASDLRAVIDNLAPVAQLIAPERMTNLLQLPPAAGLASSNDIAAAPDSLAEGAAEIIVRLARSKPLVIAIDDVQWMDPVSADALVRVAHRVSQAHVALVLAARSLHEGAVVERLSAVKEDRFIDVELPRLTAAQVSELIALHLGETTVDADLAARIHAMAGGTPLGVLEVLGAFLDAGALRPHARTWTFDLSRTDRVILPRGALVLLGRRLGELPNATRRVLESAAIIGASFEDALLAAVVELTVEDLAYALASARRAGLVEADEGGRHRFAHDSIRELLIEDLADTGRRRLHQRVAEVLDRPEGTTFDLLCATALHYAAGEPGKNQSRVFHVARAAGEAALARFDNDTSLRFLTQARVAADAASIRLEARFFKSVGEAHLRIGSLDESLASFEVALERATDANTRAMLLGRLAWVYQTRAEPDRAWAALDRAFKMMGARMPVEDVGSAATTSARIARARVGRLLSRPSRGSPAEVDLLCELHYQNARLGMEYGKPARVLQSGLESLELSERGGSPGMRARARAFYALVLTVLGRSDAGARAMSHAKESAASEGDASTIAFCVQIQSVAAAWAGEVDHSIVLYRECVDVHGPWLELNEYCQDVSTCELLESLRGRSNAAWPWIERAIERLRRSRTRPLVAAFLIHRARAALAATGREVTKDAWLSAQFASVSPLDPGRGYHRLVSWGARVRLYLETGDLGADFEDIVRTFRAEGHNPRSVHLVVSEFYVSVAHARIHQHLRASGAARAAIVPALRLALADLRACAKIPLLKAHQLAGDGYLAWVEGDARRARKFLAEAESLANQQSAPWVLYEVARIGAHMLRASGKEEAARDQARVAELFAREHGAVTRARWVREEFQLAELVERAELASLSSSVSSSTRSRTNRQLAALLQVVRAPRRDLKTEQQASVILGELIGSFHASRASIWFEPERGTAGTMVTRHRASESAVPVVETSARALLLRAVHSGGLAWPPEPIEGDASRVSVHRMSPMVDELQFDTKRTLAVPLFLYERPVGALCIERQGEGLAFGPDDRSLLVLLSHQVPIALEIARLLFEREQLHNSLQQAKKMEAMGQLAGGLAHDFNNMLAAMKVALSAARERAALDEELTVELDIIAEATTRAAQLTGQLLSFSRHRPVPVAVHDINHLVSRLEPMLRRVVGSKVLLTTKLSPAVDAVEVDEASFDQALVNLLINARDAMPSGGTLTISTRNVVLGEAAAQRHNLRAGEYVELEIIDTGEGMNAETLSRIFEPFFTTKPPGSGSGLGLAMVYAFVRNCGGSIEVTSELGQGTKFRVYFMRAERKRISRPPRSGIPSSGSPQVKRDGPDTILVVDDDDLVRRSIAKILERNGYRVLAAGGSDEALTVAKEQGERIGLVILDVLMPGVTGPELGRRISDLKLPAKLLFVSGFSPDSVSIQEAQVGPEMLLQKPFSQTALLERVRHLMMRS